MVLKFKKASDNVGKICLKAVMIGVSGSGKSYALGTLPGTTLILHTRGEEHGINSAAISSNNILSACLDIKEEIDEGAEFKKLNNNDALHADLAVFKLRTLLKGDLDVDNLALDSLTDLDLLFRKTKEFDDKTKTEKGYHNTFREGPIVLDFFREIFDLLSDQHRKGKNVVCTLAARIKDRDSSGKALDFAPMLTTFAVAEDIPRAFPQVLVLDEIEIEKEGVIKKHHAFVFDPDVKRESKDLNGVVKKMINFSPRIVGLKDDQLPDAMPNDLSRILDMLNGGKE